MEDYLKTRPKKTYFSISEQLKLRRKAEERIKEILLPNEGIQKIILIGSSVKGTFGEYEPPGFRGSLYSDFDFIVFVDDDYQISSSLTLEFDGKPFEDDNLNLAYRESKFVDAKYDAEIFFVRESSLNNYEIIKAAERAGIPMTIDSKHPHLQIFP